MTDRSASDEIWKNWQSARLLQVAWRFLGDPELMSQWRSTDDARRKSVHRKEIELDLADRLATGELAAIGLITGADTDGQCVNISPTFFASVSCEIDWMNGELKSLGRTFADVRVMHPSSVKKVFSTVLPPSPINLGLENKVGRTDTYPKSATVLRDLFLNPANCELSAEKLHPEFRILFAERYPRQQFKLDPPGVTTLRKHLKLFRQEPTETDNNEVVS